VKLRTKINLTKGKKTMKRMITKLKKRYHKLELKGKIEKKKDQSFTKRL